METRWITGKRKFSLQAVIVLAALFTFVEVSIFWQKGDVYFGNVPSFNGEASQSSANKNNRAMEIVLGKFAKAKISQKGHFKIPKILHQSWKNETLPPSYARYRQVWLEKHPGWIHHLWTDDDNREMVRLFYPWFLSYYDNFPVGVMRADSMRYLYMHRFGGMYADLDMEPLKSLDFLIDRAETPITLAYLGPYKAYKKHGLPAAFLISEPGHILWMLMIRAIIEAAKLKPREKTGPVGITGPVIFRQTFETYLEAGLNKMMKPEEGRWVRNGSLDELSTRLGDVRILAPGLIYPYDWRESYETHNGTSQDLCWARSDKFDETLCKALYPNAYTITYHYKSWADEWQAFTANATGFLNEARNL